MDFVGHSAVNKGWVFGDPGVVGQCPWIMEIQGEGIPQKCGSKGCLPAPAPSQPEAKFYQGYVLILADSSMAGQLLPEIEHCMS